MIEKEILYYERLCRLAQEHPTSFMNHAFGYIRAKIDRLKENTK